MNDLISRQAAIDEFYTDTCDVDKVEWAEAVLKRVPSAERKGHWIDITKDNEHDFFILRRLECSECGYSAFSYMLNYCPNCGADMRGEQ